MDAKAFFDLAARMREAQKSYFRTPAAAYKQKDAYYQESKRLEAKIDAEIKRVKGILAREQYKRQNPTFPGFDEELLNRDSDE